MSFVVARDEVNDRDVALLAISMTTPDALLDALRIPGQIVVDNRIAELQVKAFRAGFCAYQDS
jgi:hypothetical protein